MHEVSLAASILSKAIEIGGVRGTSKIEEVTVEVGKLMSLDAEEFTSAFQMVAKGTIAEGAKLRLVEGDVRIRCPDCGYEGIVEYKGRQYHHLKPILSTLGLKCPKCGSDAEIIGGMDAFLKGMKIKESK